MRVRSDVTKQRIQAANEMRSNGMSYREISNVLGISFQRVHFLLLGEDKSGATHFSRIKESACPYYNLRNWMNENRFGRTKMMAHIGLTQHQTFRNYLAGSSAIPKKYIDAILQVTGMTYGECFATDCV